MAKHKKKKTQTTAKRSFAVTKTYFDQFSEVVRKMLRLADLDPAFFDLFSKKQKLDMMAIKSAPARVSILKDSPVPRYYIRMIQADMTAFQKENFVRNDSAIGLTFYDFMKMGMVFLAFLDKYYPAPYTNLADNRVVMAKKMSEIMDCTQTHFMTGLQLHFQLVMTGLSKINFRLYSYQFSWESGTASLCLIPSFCIEATSAEIKVFRYNGVVRSAFRVGVATLDNQQIRWLSIPANRIFKQSDDTRQLKVYVQNHALQRIKERLDTEHPFFRNLALVGAIQDGEIVDGVNGQKLLVCTRRDMGPVGYFPFTVQNDCLFILSFLPVSSRQTPEGNRLYQVLNMSQDEAAFFGMDKLSFYRNTDFDAIPLLKEALQKAGMWHLTEIKPSEELPEIEKKSSSMMIRFFQQSRSSDEINIPHEIALDN